MIEKMSPKGKLIKVKLLYFRVLESITMPSLSMVRLVRCSSMLSNSSGSLMFSLPCLTTKETAYIQLQLATIHSTNDNAMQSTVAGERVRNIAKAYMVEDTGLTDLSKLFEVSSANEFSKFHEIMTGLAYGDMMGDPRMWMDAAKKSNYKYNSTFNIFVQKETFEERYKKRLLEVIDNLGEKIEYYQLS